MDKNRHIIKQQVFNVEVRSKKEAQQMHERVSRIYRLKLQAIIEKYLAQYDHLQENIRLEQLVLNCEYDSFEALEENLIAALQRQLPLLLGEQIKPSQKSGTLEMTKRSRSASQQKLLQHFLRKGNFPWWADSEQRDVNQLLSDLLKTQPEWLLKMLRKTLTADWPLRRFCWQTDPKVLEKIERSLLKVQYEKVKKYHQKLWRTFLRNLGAEVKTEKLKLLFQQSQFTFALQYGEQVFNERRYLQHSLQILLTSQETQLIQPVKAMLDRKQEKGKLKKIDRLLLKEWTSSQQKKWKEKKRKPRKWSSTETFFFFIQKGFYPEGQALSEEDFNEVVLNICENEKGAAFRQLNQLLEEATARLRLINHLKAKTLAYVSVKTLQRHTFAQTGLRQELLLLFGKVFAEQFTEDQLTLKIDQMIVDCTFNRNIQPLQLHQLLQVILQQLGEGNDRNQLQLINQSIEALKPLQLTNKNKLLSSFFKLYEANKQTQTVLSAAVSEEELLTYLQEGRWSGKGRMPKLKALEQTWETLLREDRADFKKQLAIYLKNARFRQGLIEQFSDSTLQMVLDLFARELAPKLPAYQSDLLQLFQHISPSVFHRQKFQLQLKHLFLTYFAAQKHWPFQATLFLEKTFKGMQVLTGQPLAQSLELSEAFLAKENKGNVLKSQLLNHLPPIHSSKKAISDSTKEALPSDFLQQLKKYLQKGPNQTRQDHQAKLDLEQELAKLLDAKDADLLNFLREHFQNTNTVHLFFEQFSPTLCQKLQGALLVSRNETLKKYFKDLRAVSDLALVGPFSKSQVNRSLEIGVFIYLIQKQSARFDPKLFLKTLCEYLAERLPFPHKKLLKSLEEKARILDQQKSFASPLPDLLQQLFPRQEQQEQQLQQQQDWSLIQCLQYFLEKGRLPQNVPFESIVVLEEHFLELLLTAPESVLKLLKTQLPKGNALENLIHHFSEETISRISQMMAASEWEATKKYQTDLRKIMSQIYVGRYSQKLLNRQIDAACLHYFSSGQRGIFKPLVFLNSVFAYLAKSLNTTLVDLSEQATQTAKKMEREIRFNSPLADLLQQLKQPETASKNTTPKIEKVKSTKGLFYFLEHGRYLPETSVQNLETIEKQLLQQLENTRQSFLSKLLKLLSKEQTFQRLTQLFAEKTRQILADQLNRQTKVWTAAYQTKLSDLLVQTRKVNYPVHLIEKAVNQAVLKSHIIYRQNKGTLADFLETLMEQLSNSFGLEQANLSIALASLAHHTTISSASTEPLLQVLKSRFKPNKKKTSTKQNWTVEDRVLAFIKTGRLDQDTSFAQKAELENHLEILLNQKENTFVRQLREALKNSQGLAEVIRQIALPLLEQLNNWLWQDIPLIPKYRQDLRVVLMAVPLKLEPRQKLPQQIEKALLYEGRSRNSGAFQAPQFILRVMRRLAIDYAVDVSELLEKTIETALQLDLKKSFASPLPNLLGQMRRSKPAPELAVASKQMILQTLQYFLEKGQLPTFQPIVDSFVDLELQLLHVVQQKDTATLRRLKNILVKSQNAPKHLLTFSQEGRAKIGHQLMLTFAANLQEVMQELQLVFSKLEPQSVSPASIQMILNTTSLTALIEAHPAQVRVDRYVEQVLLKVADRQMIPLREYVKKIDRIIEVLEAKKLLHCLTKNKLQNWSFHHPHLKRLQKITDEKPKFKGPAKNTKHQARTVLTLLENYLVGGQFKGQSAMTTFLEFEWQLSVFCEKGKKSFARKLRQVWQKAGKGQGQIKAFSKETLRTIVLTLNTHFASRMEEVMDDLKEVMCQLESVKTNSESIGLLVDESLLESLSKTQKTMPSEQALILQSLSKLVKQQATSFRKVATDLRKQTEIRQAKAQLKSQLWKHLQSIDLQQKTPMMEILSTEDTSDLKQVEEVAKAPEWSEQVSPPSAGNYWLDLLRYWLDAGAAPWWMQGGITFNQVLERLAEAQAGELLEVLGFALDSPQKAQDFLAKTSEASLDRIFQILLGPEAGWVKNVLQILVSAPNFKKQKDWKQKGHQLLSILFYYLLHTSFFDPEAFFKQCIVQLAKGTDRDLKSCLKQLKKQIKQSDLFTTKHQQKILDALKTLSKDSLFLSEGMSTADHQTRKRLSIQHQFQRSQQGGRMTISRAFEQVEYYFINGSFSDPQAFPDQADFEAMLKRLLRQFSLPSKALFIRLIRQHQVVENVVDFLPEGYFPLLIQLFYLKQSKTILSQQKCLFQLLSKGKKSKQEAERDSKIHLLQFLTKQKDQVFSLDNYVRDWCKAQASSNRQTEKQILEQLLLQMQKTKQSIPKDLEDSLHTLKKQLESAKPESNPWEKMDEKKMQLDEAVYIHNAGLAILSPFLPRYFKMLEMLEDRKFKDEATAERAVLLLQYLVSGKTETPEHLLVFNKICCGLDLDTPVPLSIELTEEEEKISGEMMRAVLQNWPQMKTSSLEGLQGGFLIRDGRIDEEEAYWALDVEQKAFDVVLQSLPWSISIINHPWMNKRVQVKWI